MKVLLRLTTILLTTAFAGLMLGLVGVIAVYLSMKDELPEISAQTDFHLEVPLRIYSSDGLLMGEYGSQRRTPVTYEQLPETLVQAFLAAEDDRYFEHPGVDYQGLVRAVLHLIKTGSRGQGGSTITMQVARNFFLSPEKSYKRKILEIFLALKLNKELSKETVLSLYLNKIYLGKRAYGVAAAAQVYYGKELNELSLAQIAMIAGLPKAPSTYNPIVNPDRALLRRDYVLRRMEELGFITAEEATAGKAESVSANLQYRGVELTAGYITEMIRAQVLNQYGDEAYSIGLNVYATVNSESQNSANRALRKALQDYDLRHGYRGPVRNLLADNELSDEEALAPEALDEVLRRNGTIADLMPAVVTEVKEQSATIYIGEQQYLELTWTGIEWARAHLSVESLGPKITTASEPLTLGDLIYVIEESNDAGNYWRLAQYPAVQGAFVAVNPADGAVLAVAGGYDFYASKFNRATQSLRQPGSSIKPFLYSAALEKGYTPATIINDAPVVFENDDLLETAWRPENYSGRFYGPTRMRKALINSRNLVSIRIARSIGIRYFVNYLTKFGFKRENLPRDLSLALGSAAVSPMDLAEAFSTFANGGYKVEPYLISSIANGVGEEIWRAEPHTVCDQACEKQRATEFEQFEADHLAWTIARVEEPLSEISDEPVAPAHPPIAPRIIPATNWYLMNSMLQDVVRRGTATRAKALGRQDIGGKTGTTNDQKDAWFSGFNPQRVAIAWVGFDKVQTLGKREVGGRAALPMWIDFMREELANIPDEPLQQPPGLTTVRISKTTGERVGSDSTDSMFETFRLSNVPSMAISESPRGSGNSSNAPDSTGRQPRYDDVEDLF